MLFKTYHWGQGPVIGSWVETYHLGLAPVIGAKKSVLPQ